MRKKGLRTMYLRMSTYISERNREEGKRRNQAVTWSTFLNIEILTETEKLLNGTSKKKVSWANKNRVVKLNVYILKTDELLTYRKSEEKRRPTKRR